MKILNQIEETYDPYEIFNNVEESIKKMLSSGYLDIPKESLFQEKSIEKANAISNCNEYLILAFCEANKSDECRDDNYITRLLKMAKRQADIYYERNPESFLASA